MRNIIVTALAVLALNAATAEAQFGGGGGQPGGMIGPRQPPLYGPGYRPALSPYLNLLRGGDTSQNYYLGVIPEQQRRANDRFYRREIADLEDRTRPDGGGFDEDEDIPQATSGTRTYFNNTAGYYRNSGAFASTPVTRAGTAPPKRSSRTR